MLHLKLLRAVIVYSLAAGVRRSQGILIEFRSAEGVALSDRLTEKQLAFFVAERFPEVAALDALFDHVKEEEFAAVVAELLAEAADEDFPEAAAHGELLEQAELSALGKVRASCAAWSL